ncbi:hypothetical protein [Caulobacter sp. 17J65-9]|uniref:hypothetical protein n=1 Tax=Caulobacter sp. 17J65-9 TaxID=2709382 RepID=UPI0013C862FF|nr:hypothetical protein [Caulobacter sp. 17J65-9]NEX92768.1 hypothetical protein [Caulobacter sp. 17J65-9]
MLDRRLALAALAAAPLLFAAAPADPLVGNWTLDAAASDDVGAAVDKAIAPMNFAIRPIAKSRLMKTNPVYKTLGITLPPGKISVSFDGYPPAVGPADGSTVKWKRRDGEVLDLSNRIAGGQLIQTFGAPDGTRKNVYSVGADGRMTMAATVTSSKLPKPLTYKLVFRKAG